MNTYFHSEGGDRFLIKLVNGDSVEQESTTVKSSHLTRFQITSGRCEFGKWFSLDVSAIKS